MSNAVRIDDIRRAAIFEFMAELIGGMAQLGAGRFAMSLDDLNDHLQAGTVFQMTAAVGLSGPFDIRIQGVTLEGALFEVATIDAPLRASAFQFYAANPPDRSPRMANGRVQEEEP